MQEAKDTPITQVVFGYKGQAKKWEMTLTQDGLSALRHLRRDLRETDGTLLGRLWRSFSKLKQLKDEPYHCHLNRHEVAIWQLEKEGVKLRCTFIYLGPRKDAPY